MQVQKAKEQLFGVPAPRKPFVGQWQKKRKPTKDPVDPRKYFCEVCNVTCGGPDSFEAHLVGKSHKHKEGLKTGKIRLDLNRPGYHCEVCNATCTAKDAFTAHLNGVKHNRVSFALLFKPYAIYCLLNIPYFRPSRHSRCWVNQSPNIYSNTCQKVTLCSICLFRRRWLVLRPPNLSVALS